MNFLHKTPLERLYYVISLVIIEKIMSANGFELIITKIMNKFQKMTTKVSIFCTLAWIYFKDFACFICYFLRSVWWNNQISCIWNTLEIIRENIEQNWWKMPFFHEISNFQVFELKNSHMCTYNLIDFCEFFRMPFSEFQNFY